MSPSQREQNLRELCETLKFKFYVINTHFDILPVRLNFFPRKTYITVQYAMLLNYINEVSASLSHSMA